METYITHRFPRPMGLTALSIEYQKTNSDDTKDKLYNYLINQWFMNSGLICGVSYDINSLAIKFGIDPSYIKEFMRDGIINSRIWDKDRQEDLINGLLGEQLAWAIEDRMEIVQQTALLKASQGGKYTPFISAELNKALKLRLEASTSLQSIIRGMTGGNQTNIFNQFNQQNINHTENTITIEEARNIIQDSIANIPINEDAKLLSTKYDIAALPQVIATDQTGIDTTKEGLGINKVELNAITDNYKGALESASREHHELRREIEENIDLDSEDPELDIYEDTNEDENNQLGINSFASQFLIH